MVIPVVGSPDHPTASAGPQPSEVSSERAWRPRPWIAAVLNVVTWGLGTLYTGRPRRAMGTFVLVQLVVAALIALTFVVSWPFVRIMLLVVAMPGAIIFTAADGWRTARRATQTERRSYQRWYVLLGVWFVATMLIQPRILSIARDHVQAFRVPSGSMTPTVVEGDYLFAVMHVPDPLQRGTVVVHQDDHGAGFLRRVVGLPGDTLEMRHHQLFVNGVAAVEPYANMSDSTDYESPEHFKWQVDYAPSSVTGQVVPTSATWGPLVVPPGQLFLLGDARDASLDSRHLGFFPVEWVIGRPSWIYLSRDAERGAIRWDRLGRAVR
jgi:signal peptidase I